MTLRLLHYSDLEIAYDDPTSIGRLATAIDRMRTPDTVVIGTGDNTAPGALPLAREGRQATSFFDAVDADIDTLGNHDFDFGLDRAREHVRESPQTWVGANIVEDGEPFANEDGKPFASEDGDPFASDAGLVPWTIVETDRYRVGIVGIVHPGTGRMNPLATDLSFEAARPAAERAIDDLRKEDVDAVVLAAHVGSGRADSPGGRDLAAELDVDAVLDGHNHAPTVERVDGGTPYARPGKGATTLTLVDLGEPPRIERIETDQYEPDPSLVEDLHAQADQAGLTETVGRLSEPLDCSRSAVDGGESRVGNLVTDAFRSAAGADVAMIAPEGIRSQGPLDGELTVWDVYSLVPFDGDLVTLELSGDRLRETLAGLSVNQYEAFPDWMCGHVSGGRLLYDEDGNLLNATVGGEPVDPDRQYRLATSEYYVENEDLFPSLTAEDVIDRHDPQYRVITEYVRHVEEVPPVEGRIEHRSSEADR